MLVCNPKGDYPNIHKSAYVDMTATIIGKVNIGKNVFVGPGAVIRADEPDSSIKINDNCNVQDRVIIHALEKSSVLVEENTSLSHGCIIHGPCKIGRNSFIGFGSVVFDAEIGEGVVIKHLAVVEGINISKQKMIESGKIINRKEDTIKLKKVNKKLKYFIQNVINVNLDLVKIYKKR